MANIDLGGNWETLLAIAGGLIVLIDLFKKFKSIGQPITDLKEGQKQINDKLATDRARLDNLERALSRMVEYQEQSSATIGLAVAELLNHTITGNDVDKLKQKEDELNSFFYKKDLPKLEDDK
jgi:hypothetical protein